MFPLFNVKFMDLLVFVSGFCFGSLPGVLVGVFTWLVYGTLNPLGLSLPVLVATTLGEAVFGFVGGLSRRFGLLRVPSVAKAERKEYLASGVQMALLGFLLTFFYDFFTNIVFGWSWGLPIVAALASGVPFAVLHQGSNLAFFLLGGPALIVAIQKVAPKEIEVTPVLAKGGLVWISVGLVCSTVFTSMFAFYYHEEYTRNLALYRNTLKDLDAVTVRVNLLINYGNETREWHNATRVPLGASLLNATLSMADVNYTVGPFGAFVNRINGVGGGNKYWLWWYWNSTSSEWMTLLQGCDQFVLHNEDTVAWYYTSEWNKPPT